MFTYSAQEGTRAAQLADDVPEAVKRERLERVTERQRLITADRYDAVVGTLSRGNRRLGRRGAARYRERASRGRSSAPRLSG